MAKSQTKNKPIVETTEIIEDDELVVESPRTSTMEDVLRDLNGDDEPAPRAQEPAKDPLAPPPVVPTQTLVFNFPVAKPRDYPEGGAQSKRIAHIDLQLSRRQAEALRFLFCGIDQLPHLRLNNGRPICTQHDALRWMLDQIADNVPECNEVTPISNWDG